MRQGRSRRRSLRRAVAVPCAMQSNYWDGPLTLSATDLSHEGVWIDTPLPLEPGEELVLSFRAPGHGHVELWALAEVARVGLWRRADDSWPHGMGLVFTYFSAPDRALLAHALHGRPPRLPARAVRRRPPPLPNRRGSVEVDEIALPPVLALPPEPALASTTDELTFTSVAPLLTSPLPLYVWGRAI